MAGSWPRESSRRDIQARLNQPWWNLLEWPEEIAGMEESGNFVCAVCGERNVIPLEVSAGRVQSYVEDCQVCCRPNRLVVRWSRDRRRVKIEAAAED